MSMIPASLKPLGTLLLIAALGTAYSTSAQAHRVVTGGSDYGALIGLFDYLYGDRHHKRHYGHHGRDYHPRHRYKDHHYKGRHHKRHHRYRGHGRHHYRGRHHDRGHRRRHH